MAGVYRGSLLSLANTLPVLADLQERLPALPQPVVIFYRNHLRSYLPDLSFVTLHW